MHVTEDLRHCSSLVADENNERDEPKDNDCAGHADYYMQDIIIHSCIFFC